MTKIIMLATSKGITCMHVLLCSIGVVGVKVRSFVLLCTIHTHSHNRVIVI